MTPFGPDLWLSDGPAVIGAAGFRFPTHMAVVRLPGEGGLWVWSPVALTPDLRAAVDTLGPVRHLVAPNGLHYTFFEEWAEAYPDARVHAAPGLTEQTAGTVIHATLGNMPDQAWEGAVDQVVVRGNRITTEVVFFHRTSSCALVTDLVQQIPRGWYRGWRAVVARLDLMTAPMPSVPRKFRMAMTDKAAAREAVERILDWPSERLVMAHGAPIEVGGRRTLQAAVRVAGAIAYALILRRRHRGGPMAGMQFAYLIEPPFNFQDETGAVRGHDVEIARHVFEQLGEGFEPIETEFARLLPGLEEGRWQMTTGLFATDDRRSYALFTRPIWALPDGLLVAKGNPRGLTGYRSVADNGGRRPSCHPRSGAASRRAIGRRARGPHNRL